MTKNGYMRLHRIYNIILAICVIIAGALFIYGCLSIYYSGNAEPYSRQIVADTFKKISYPVYACLGLCIVGFILEIVHPLAEKKKKDRKAMEFANFVASLRERKNDFENVEEYYAEILLRIEKERKSRILYSAVCLSVIALSFAVSLAYFVDLSNFPVAGDEITPAVVRAMSVLGPCLAIAFAASLVLILHDKKSTKIEGALVNRLEKGEKDEKDEIFRSAFSKISIRNAVTAVIIIAAIALIVVGALSDGAAAVLTKAVNICTECIGLG